MKSQLNTVIFLVTLLTCGSLLCSASGIEELMTISDLVEKIHSGDLIVMMFTARWCAMCRAAYPAYNEVANDPTIAAAARFYTVDMDTNWAAAEAFYVYELPTFIIFKENAEKDTLVGATAEKTLKRKINLYM